MVSSKSAVGSKRATHGEQHEEDVLDDPRATDGIDMQGLAPRMPIVTLSILAVAPAAKPLVQVEAAIAVYIAAVSHLQVAEPIAHNVNEGRDGSAQHTSGNQNEPYLARVGNLLDMAQQARGTRVQVSETLALLCVFKDPVDGSEVVVAYAAARALYVPVEARLVFCVVRRGIVGLGIEVGQNALGGVVVGRIAGAALLGERRCAVLCGAEGGGEEAWETEGRGGRGLLLALEGEPVHIST